MTFHRSTFLTLSSLVALAIATLATALPTVLLESKGVRLPNPAAVLWVREVGVLIFGSGLTLFLVRHHEDSPSLRALFLGNAVVQIGLLPLELLAYRDGVITLVSGIIPNSVLHGLLAAAFFFLARRIRLGEPRGAAS